MLTSPRRLLVLDDDPTGSQCVSDMPVAFKEDAALLAQTLADEGSSCFVLTNTRALDEADAIAKNQRIVAGVLKELGEQVKAGGLHLVSRSDSTLRGHVIAEPNALADTLAEAGIETDVFLFCPAMLEAGRFTEGDVHYAMVDGQAVLVEHTDFAKDATFGYHTSHLAAFLEEKSGGQVKADQVLSLSLEDIRQGGVELVRQKLAGASNRQWVIVNSTDYSDMEVVADAVTQLEAEGKVFISRCGPSFVRPLAGQQGAEVLTPESIKLDSGRLPHGLLVVGSHVGLTTAQLAEVQAKSGLAEFELQVEKLLDEAHRAEHIDAVVAAVRQQLETQDCVVYTSRTLISTDDPAESLAIARSVSDAVVEVVQKVRTVLPAWVIAKGGITSHEVAHRGLGIRLARAEGQFFPGQISLFTPLDAPAEVLGNPYVVFPGNVGSKQALADVVARLKSATAA
ncbi:MAG: four-carbon acid sugar kinase family protein [Rothia sp. (in: high G+C Gram-positive bacteria)]|nr:four-carbon acid sugar kinase family protein [Rothia sp. (in: high G+C Gram-positive bacteria)]